MIVSQFRKEDKALDIAIITDFQGNLLSAKFLSWNDFSFTEQVLLKAGCVPVSARKRIWQYQNVLIKFSEVQSITALAESLKAMTQSESPVDVREYNDWENFHLKQITLDVEKYWIKKALVESNRSVTAAARLLGITYQDLAYQLNHQHKDLAELREPAKRRPKKNIIKAKSGQK